MDSYTKKAIINRINKIIDRVEEEKGHTNGYTVASTIKEEINKLK